jgi:pSer/pThr/pTyr-binding forkhead associated (FHA) protein
METDDVRIVASFSGESLPETQGVPAAAQPGPESDAVPSNAFLIIGGTRIIPLTQPVINIGRRLDNQVVVDDPRVSRNHAQLRVIKSRYVIFDLDSTGGTFINGQRANQSVLYPGDVISLSGVTLVFGQDVPSARQAAQERPVSTVSAERATVILKKEKDEPE